MLQQLIFISGESSISSPAVGCKLNYNASQNNCSSFPSSCIVTKVLHVCDCTLKSKTMDVVGSILLVGQKRFLTSMNVLKLLKGSIGVNTFRGFGNLIAGPR